MDPSPQFSATRPAISAATPTPRPLSAEDIAHFRQHGWVVQRGAMDEAAVGQITSWIDEVELWSTCDGPGLHHFEQTDDGPRVARSEEIIEGHEPLGTLIGDTLASAISPLFGEDAVLFKEKINYKYPGGGGFAPHQDATAYRFVDHHISCMVPLDPATIESGCLYVADGYQSGLMAPDDRGRVGDEVASTLEWQAAEVYPGDLLWFDSYTPHYSETNRTERPRRAMYLTYNAASAGSFRDTYYRDKHAEFAAQGASFGDERVRISISDDFLGKPVVTATADGTAPTDDPATDPGVAAVLDLMRGPLADEIYDEAITEREHGLQAGLLARDSGASAALVVAALLHDLGHMVVGDLSPIDVPLARDHRHEAAGAVFLRQYYGPEVCAPIALHVAAKRYLCAVDPDYRAQLTPSSERSLQVQGGPMGPAEVARFERLKHFEDAVALRRWDDLAKVAGLATPPIEDFVGELLAARQ